MARKRFLFIMTAIFLIAYGHRTSWAGPKDQNTKYPVGIEVGGHKTNGIADTAGATFLSFEDAKSGGPIGCQW